MENPQGIQAFDSSRIKFIGCPSELEPINSEDEEING